MHQHTLPADVSLLRTDLAQFCVAAGYSKIAEDSVVARLHNVLDGANATPGNGRLLLHSGFTVNHAPRDVTLDRLVLKDPGADCWVHMIFYSTDGVGVYEGVQQARHYVDFYLSNGWNCSASGFDAHPGMGKLTTLVSLPDLPVGLDLFSATNSEGKLCVHAAVEGGPLVFTHFGFGCLEKLLDFTGGDYVTAHVEIQAVNFNWMSSFAYAGPSVISNSPYYLQSGYYCPDLDVPNKLNSTNLYRSFTGCYTSDFLRSDIERGTSSLVVGYNGTLSAPSYPFIGGELSSLLFPSPNPWSGGSPLLPVVVLANDGIDVSYVGAVGYFPHLRSVNITNLNHRDEMVLGPDVWAAFPVKAKTGVTAAAYNTQNAGYVILKG